MRYFQRLIAQELIDFIEHRTEHKDVLVIHGARQVGKSTLLEHVVQSRKALILNLERYPATAAHIDRCANFAEFTAYLYDTYQFRPAEHILIIDEAQQSEQLGQFVRFMKEEWTHATVILTGSLLSELYRNTPRRPVGRETFRDMWPLSFTEFLMAAGQDSLVTTLQQFQLGDSITPSQHERFLHWFNEYLRVGGLPEVVAYYLDHKDYAARRADIYKAYEDDFVRYFKLEDINLFRRCLTAVAANVGSVSKDTQAVGLDRPGYKKIAGIFSRLEKWRLIIRCEQLGMKPEKTHFFPKRYLYDLGILGDLRLRGLQHIALQDLATPALRTPLGGIVENAIALSLRAQYGDTLAGIRLGSRAEIDFCARHGEHVHPVECKISLRFKAHYLRSIRRYQELCGGGPVGLLLYGGLPQSYDTEKIHCLPYYLCDAVKRLLTSV